MTVFLPVRVDGLAKLVETTAERPDVDGLVVGVLHQLDFRSSVPPGLDVTRHASRLLRPSFLCLIKFFHDTLSEILVFWIHFILDQRVSPPLRVATPFTNHTLWHRSR